MRTVIITTTAAAALVSSPAFAQQPSQDTTSIPDFSGIWAHPSFPGFEPPVSGPGPLTNKSRIAEGPQKGRSNNNQLVGDYTNPILKPQTADIVKKQGEIELSGALLSTPRNQCWSEPPPFVFSNYGMQMLQQPDNITILYLANHQVRHVRMNKPHLPQMTPSWYGDSVGRYEGNTLVIDTVGIKADRPLAMIDHYATPYTSALHVVERYRLIDYEAAKEALERDAKENFLLPQGGGDLPVRADPNYRGNHLQLQFTVEDEGVFTMPWSATITYRPGLNWRGTSGATEWPEVVCAENPNPHEYAAIPRADKPDF
jgi:hypothetical protein